MTSLKNFLSPEEQEMVTSAVQDAERITSGEIVPMVVSRSHDYPAATIAAALTLTIPVSLLLSGFIGARLWIGSDNVGIFIAITALLYVFTYPLLKKTNSFTALFLNPKTVQEEVEKGALAAFYGQKLYRTRDENGILIYISVFERKVWILADKSINEKIAEQEWARIVTELTSEIKRGRQAEAISRAVREVGAILQHHFPYKKDDENELHNLILRDEF